MKKLIRFDWAIKKLLRNKANFFILEGFLSELLPFDVSIESLLESEGNQQSANDKFNRVDILVRSRSGELMLVEVQNDPEDDYFQRMIYGVAKLITEYIQTGQPYGAIKKTFSINIVYFGLGQGTDYVYEYRGQFVGIHQEDVLIPTDNQKRSYALDSVADIFPKYYILKVNDFDDTAHDTLDEWIYFLKNSEIKDEFRAKGLQEAREVLQYERLPYEEQKAYERFVESKRIEKSVTMTAVRLALQETAFNAIKNGLANELIHAITGLSIEEVESLRQKGRAD